MTCRTRSQRETGADISVLVLGLITAIAAFRWSPLYGPWLWMLAWGAALLAALLAVIVLSALRTAHERCLTAKRPII